MKKTIRLKSPIKESTLCVRMRSEVKDVLRAEAEKDEKSLTVLLEEIILKYLADKEIEFKYEHIL